MSYKTLSEPDKKKLLQKEYVKDGLSFAEIANKYDTYANKVRRDAIKYKIPIRDKTQAQKNVLAKGKAKHPTKGKARSEEEKQKIGMGIYNSWANMSESELKQRKQKARDVWNKLSEDEKYNRRHSAYVAIRESSKYGSKLEKFLLDALIGAGYKVEFHKEQILSNTKLQIDIYLPELTTAIEVDGPSHFEPVWGQDTLQRNQKYDNKKTGLIIGRGMKLVRIKQSKDFSATRARLIFEKLDKLLTNISSSNQKTFNIEDE